MNTKTKLKVAAEEIKEILRKHDLAGAVSLHSPGHGEFFIHLNPSYSNAYMYNDNEVRFHSKRSDFKTLEEQLQKQADTSNMLKILMDITAMNFGYIQQMSETFDNLVGAEHS
jgi:hypothetical protein